MTETTQTSRLIPVGCDDGHFAIKICAGRDKYFTVPSRVIAGQELVSDDQGNTNEDLLFEVAPNEFVTIVAYDGMSTKEIDTRDPDFALSSANRALVYHGLNRCVEEGIIPEGIDVNMISGLPVDRFYSSDGKPDSEFIDKKAKSLTMPISNKGGAYLPTVAKHLVISEAVASYFDALYDFEGNENEDFKLDSEDAPIAVVDVGGKTLDVAVVREGGNGLYFSRSGTTDAGVLYFYRSLNEAIIKHFQKMYPDAQLEPFSNKDLDSIVKSGSARCYTRHDVSNIVNKELDDFASRVRSFIQPKIGDGARFGRILFVGGGANLLHDRLPLVFPNVPLAAISAKTPTDDLNESSTFSNARGMYKAARFLIK